MYQYEIQEESPRITLRQMQKEVICTNWIKGEGETFYEEILYYQELFGNDVNLHDHFLTVDKQGNLIYKYPFSERHDDVAIRDLMNNMRAKVAKYPFKPKSQQYEEPETTFLSQQTLYQYQEDPETIIIPSPTPPKREVIKLSPQPQQSNINNPQKRAVYNEQKASQEDVRANRQAVVGGGLNFTSNNPGSRQQRPQPQPRQQAPSQRDKQKNPAQKQRKSIADKTWMNTIIDNTMPVKNSKRKALEDSCIHGFVF